MAHFRLLDLSAELRNLIYERALCHDRRHGKRATSQLLSTCKQVHGEAKAILYNQSALTVDINIDKGGNRTVSGDVSFASTPTEKKTRPETYAEWPLYVSRLRYINVKLDLENKELGWSDRGTDVASAILYSLSCVACSIQADAIIVKVDVSMVEHTRLGKSHHELRMKLWKDVFCPLVGMPYKAILVLTGFPGNVAHCISARHQHPSTAVLKVNTLAELHSLCPPFQMGDETLGAKRGLTLLRGLCTNTQEYFDARCEVLSVAQDLHFTRKISVLLKFRQAIEAASAEGKAIDAAYDAFLDQLDLEDFANDTAAKAITDHWDLPGPSQGPALGS